MFVLVEGEIDPQTQKSWCPDCVKAEGPLTEFFSKLDNVLLLKCPVSRNEFVIHQLDLLCLEFKWIPIFRYKNNPNYPYRKHPQLKITAIPTLIHWGETSARERLVGNYFGILWMNYWFLFFCNWLIDWLIWFRGGMLGWRTFETASGVMQMNQFFFSLDPFSQIEGIEGICYIYFTFCWTVWMSNLE